MSSMLSLSRSRARLPKSTYFLTFLCFGILYANIVVAQSTCSASSPCPAGCCSKWGNCGYGPDFCSKDNCVNNCDVKADCDPGSWGKEYVTLDHCPLNVCCSKHGFCGTTDEFCGDVKVKQPECTIDRSKSIKRVVGYYESWSITRPCNGFWPRQIPVGVYTHLNFAFASIDPNTFEIVPSSTQDERFYALLTDLKLSDPDLKIMIAIGGWSFNDPGPTANTFSDLARSADAQRKFIKSLGSFMSTYGFDGVDLDWEYPGAPDRSGKPDDFANFPVFMRRLRGAFRDKQLSITLPASLWYLQHFDIKALEKHVDFFNIMTYDFHGTWDKASKWVGPYLNSHTNLTEIDQGLDLLWRNDIDPQKVTMGLAFYGRGFTATSSSCMKPGCTYESGSPARDCSREVSVLLNSEIDEMVQQQGLRPTMDAKAAVKILQYDNNKWATYDDEVTLLKKVDYARSRCLGGIMVWAVSHDTKDGKYSKVIAKVAGRKVLSQGKDGSEADGGEVVVTRPIDQCRWTGCKEGCPANWITMTRSDPDRTGQAMQNEAGCGQGGVQTFCCPPDKPLPTCGWWSHNNGRCTRSCPSGYTEIGSNAQYCNEGALGILTAQSACCTTDVDSMHLYGQCEWKNSLFCSQDTCDKETVAYSFTGSGDVMCAEGVTVKDRLGDPDKEPDNNKAKYCCDQKPNSQWDECIWLESSNGVCNSQCPPELTRVAMDWVGCREGTGRARCCKASYNIVRPELSTDSQEVEALMKEFMDSPVCTINGVMVSDGSGFRRRASDNDGLYELTDSQLVRRSLSEPEQRRIHNNVLNTFFIAGAVSLYRQRMWDDAVTPHYPGLTFSNITSWLNHSPLGIQLQMGTPAREAAYQMLCDINGLNSDVIAWGAFGSGGGGGGGGSGTTICLCVRDDCCEPDDSTCIEHPANERRSLFLDAAGPEMSLAKRADIRDFTVEGDLPPGQNMITLEWLFPDHPSGNDWIPAGGPPAASLAIIQEGYYWNPNCLTLMPANMDVRVNGKINGDRWNTDHKFEKQTAMELVHHSCRGQLPLKGANTNYDLFRIGMIHRWVPSTFWDRSMEFGSPGSRPIDLMLEALGSKTNQGVFSFLVKPMNQLKETIWGRKNIVEREKMNALMLGNDKNPLTLQTLEKGLSHMEHAIQVWEWHCIPRVVQQYKTIILDMRQALRLGEQYHRGAFNQEAHAVDFFDEWIQRYFKVMRENVSDFVKDAILAEADGALRLLKSTLTPAAEAAVEARIKSIKAKYTKLKEFPFDPTFFP